jgi:hypothetical protein
MDSLKNTLTNVPLNKTAALVVGKGESYIPNLKKYPPCYHSKTPIATSRYPGSPENDLTGKRFERFRVIGYFRKGSVNHNSMWVVRCDCGDYEVRRRDAFNPGQNKKLRNQCCINCQHLEELKKGAV